MLVAEGLVDVVDDEDWICELGDAMANQIPLYNLYPDEKVLLYIIKCFVKFVTIGGGWVCRKGVGMI